HRNQEVLTIAAKAGRDRDRVPRTGFVLSVAIAHRNPSRARMATRADWIVGMQAESAGAAGDVEGESHCAPSTRRNDRHHTHGFASHEWPRLALIESHRCANW